MERKKITVPKIMKMKKDRNKIVMLSTYDYPFARLADQAGVDIILVGDSLGMVILGYDNTLPVTMEEMLIHVKAVTRAKPSALVVADMPFMSFHGSLEMAIVNAGRFIKEGGADGVKIEGGQCVVDVAQAICKAKIPVMGHVGLTPQSVMMFGGYKVQGRTEEARGQLIEDALALQEAGCFAIVLEGIPWQVAKEITERVRVPTIGIGAGHYCDGQVLVSHDLLGIYTDHAAKYVRCYANLANDILDAFQRFARDVRSGDFPSLEESYSLEDSKDS
ncbi:MAG: 3-methyl-2-oxobutanoate hydroxymethyltransferase [bacterium]